MKRAFTLIEVIIVLVIVGIFAALLFPVFHKARENARRSSCQSNLKQIGLGFKQYERDYDEKFALAYSNEDGVSGYDPSFDRGWMQITQPYLKSTLIFQCPSEPASYAPPLRANDYWYSAPVAQLQRISEVSDPALTVVIGDAVGSSAALVATHGAIAYGGDAPSLKYNGEIWDISEASDGQGARRHLRGSNFAFCDGHVKWFRPEAVGAAPLSAKVATFRVN